MSKITTLDSQIVYKNRWMEVREDKIRRPSGAEGLYGVVDKPDFVVIVPIQDNAIHLVEQYRYPVKGRYWELPQGSWEASSESSNLEVAVGELREETGLVAANMTYVGYQYLAYGYSNQGYHIYLATDLTQTDRALDAEEEDLITQAFSLVAFEKMLCSGEIKDATTVTAYSLVKLKGMI